MDRIYTLQDLLENEAILAESLGPETPETAPFGGVRLTKTQEVALGSGVSFEEAQVVVDSGNEAQAVQTVLASTPSVDETISRGYQEGLSAEETLQQVEDQIKKTGEMSLREYSLLQSLLLTDGEINPDAARSLTNLDILNQVVTREIEASDDGWLTSIAKGADVWLLRGILLGTFEDLTFRTDREGVEIRDAVSSMPPDEFRQWVEGYVADRRKEGIFSEDFVGNLYSIQEDAYFMGNNPSASAFAILSLFDIIPALKGLSGVGKAADLARARTAVDKIAVARGEVAGAEAAAKLVDDLGVQIGEITAGRTLPEDLDPTPSPQTRIANPTFRNATRKNVIVEEYEQLNRQGSFGYLFDRATLEAAAAETAEAIRKRVNDVVVTTRRLYDEGSNNYRLVVRMGKEGSGEPFRLKADAEAIVGNDPSLRVVRSPRVFDEQGNAIEKLADVEEGKVYTVKPEGWYIEAETRLDVFEMVPEFEKAEAENFILRSVRSVFEASTTRLPKSVSSNILSAESAVALGRETIKPVVAKFKKLGVSEINGLDNVMEQLRDGEYSWMRQAPDTPTFEAMYELLNGVRPSKKTVEAYHALIDLSDATWHFKASERLNRVAAAGGEMITIRPDYETLGYRLRNNSEIGEELVLDLTTGVSRKVNELQPDAIVYKVPEHVENHLYVVNTKKARVPERIDVMPYNVGGPRTNEGLRWFIGSTQHTLLKGTGTKSSTGFRTLLGSFGEKQARQATKELNNIVGKVKELLERYGLDDIRDLNLSRADFEDLGRVIRENNSWHKHVTDLDDLKRLANDYNFKFTEEFNARFRDEEVSIDDMGQDITLASANYGEVSMIRGSSKRGDTPLLEYGKGKVTNASPVKAISDQFNSEAFGYANRNASQNAIIGWVKLAEKSPNVKFQKGIPENDYLARMLTAEIGDAPTDVVRQLREQREVIKRRINQPTWLSIKWKNLTNDIAEYVFDKSGIKMDINGADPASQLMAVGFYSKFGFLNPDQFVLQALHTATIAMISPIHGTKGGMLAIPMSVLTHPMLSAEAKAKALKSLYKVPGVDADEIKGLVEYIQQSGRAIIDMEVAELQGPQRNGVASTMTERAKNIAKDALDTSALFFKEGERLSRMTGIITAYLEHRAKRPGINPLSKEGREWIVNREQDLTFRMTSQSRSVLQDGWRRVPTQWWSFTRQALVNMTISRDFTVGEKIRMAVIMGPVYGMTGIGAGKMTGYFMEKMGYDPTDPATVEKFNNYKYGFLDMFLSDMLGVDTAYAQRVAPIGQVQDIWQKMWEENLFSNAFGASGDIGTDILSGVLNTLRLGYSGQGASLGESVLQVARNISTVDKIAKIKEITETGQYRSRRGRTAVTGLPPEAGAAILFGATPAAVVNTYDYNEIIRAGTEKERETRTEFQSRAANALYYLTKGDRDDMLHGTKLWEEMIADLYARPLAPSVRDSILRSLLNANSMPEIMRNAIRHGSRTAFEATLVSQQRQ